MAGSISEHFRVQKSAQTRTAVTSKAAGGKTADAGYLLENVIS
jgi:hypothetical protein